MEKEALEILLNLEKSQPNNGKIKNMIGTIYWKFGDEQNAFKYLQQANFNEPNLTDAKFNLGIIIKIKSKAILIEKRGDINEAKKNFEEILDYEPKHYNTLVHLGILEAKNADYDVAIELLKRARNINNNDTKITDNLANIYMKQGKFEEASPLYEEILKIETDSLKIMKKFMICLGKIENYEKLEKICRKILSVDKTNSKALAFLARALKENGKFVQLENLLLKIGNKIENFTKNNNNKIDTVLKIKTKLKEKLVEIKHLKFNDKNESDGDSESDKDLPLINILKVENEVPLIEEKNLLKFKNQYKLDENDKESLFYLGNHHFRLEEYEISLQFFLKLKEIDRTYNEEDLFEKLGKLYFYFKGYIYFKQKNWEESSSHLEISNSIRPKDMLFVKIGRCFEKKKEYNQSLVNYKNSLELTKDFIWGIFYLGLLLIKIGRKDEGFKYLKQAYEQNNNNINKTEIVKKYCEELIKYDDEIDVAIVILSKTIETVLDNSDILVLLSKAYEKKENYIKAIEVLEEALKIKNFYTNANKMFQLGLLYEKGQNFNKAISLYKNILVLNKDHLQSLCHLASILSHAKEFKRAMKYYKYALTIDENLAFANFGIGKIYQSTNQIQDALKYYNICLENDSKNHK